MMDRNSKWDHLMGRTLSRDSESVSYSLCWNVTSLQGDGFWRKQAFGQVTKPVRSWWDPIIWWGNSAGLPAPTQRAKTLVLSLCAQRTQWGGSCVCGAEWQRSPLPTSCSQIPVSKMDSCGVSCPGDGSLLQQPKLMKTHIHQTSVGVADTHLAPDVLSVRTVLCLANGLLWRGRCIALGTSPVERVSIWGTRSLSVKAGSSFRLHCLYLSKRKRKSQSSTLLVLLWKKASMFLGIQSPDSGGFCWCCCFALFSMWKQTLWLSI